MVILDVTVVNVALPSIGTSLNFSLGDLQWVVTAYVLFTGGLMLLGGRLADLAGRRRIFLVGLGIFTVGSLASGLASSPTMLIVTRAVQGVGAALLLPSGLSIVTTTYEGHQRAVALAVWGALGAAGAAAGVLIGGVLTSALSWHWIFFINVPIGVVVGVLALHTIESKPTKIRFAELDLPGAVALMGGLAALVLAAQGAADNGWTSTHTAVRASLATVLLVCFAGIELHSSRPLVRPSVWRNRSLVAGAGVMLTATGLLVGGFFLNTLYLQNVLNASPIETGMAFLPLTLMVLVGAHAASSHLPKIGTRTPMVAGLVFSAVGTYLLSRAPGDASYAADILPGFLGLGFGVGMTFVSVSVAAMADVEDAIAGLASGMMTTAHEIGAAIGVAVLAAIASASAGAGATSQAQIVDGHHDALIAAVFIALAGAVAAATLVPTTRPEPGAGHSMH
jgi:EmrB/QacA subfamily drug resistance transporter